MAVTLDAPHLQVHYADGSTAEVTTHMGDLMAYEKTAKQNKWPMVQEGGTTHWLLYLGFVHLKTAGDLNGIRFDDWATTVKGVTNLDVDGNPAEDVAHADPTQPAPVPV